MPGRISRPKTASAYDGVLKSGKSSKGNDRDSGSSSRKRKQRERGLNAFAIAAAEHGDADQGRLQKHRLARQDEAAVEPLDSDSELASNEEDDGVDEDEDRGPRRKKQRRAAGSEEDDDDFGEDSEIDSDEAFGESDEERFEGFTFRGSSSGANNSNGKKRIRSEAEDEVDLDEEDDGSEYGESLGEDAVDLAQMLDEDGSENGGFGGFDDDEGEEAQHAQEEKEEDSLSEDDDYIDEMQDENEEDEKERVKQLQDFVSSLPSTDKDADQSAAQKVQPTAARMLAALKTMPAVDPAFAHSLKKFSAANEAANSTTMTPRASKGAKNSVVQPPLPKRQQDRVDRAVAYDKAKQQLNEWLDTVKFNRRAEHLTFPLQDPSASEPLGTSKFLPTGHNKPRSALESAISTILEESGMGGSTREQDKRIQEAEASQLKANNVPLDEILARRAELRKARDLLFHEEKRSKRIKKIKSKAYRRVHRKEAERTAQKEKNLLAAAGMLDDEDDEEEKERQDRRRAEARMGQRHRESRWAKNAKAAGRAKWDEDVQNGLVERARRSEDLKKRMEGISAGEDSDREDSAFSDESGDDETDDDRLQRQLESISSGVDTEGVQSGSKLASMKFMQRAEAARKKANDEAVEQLQRELANGEREEEEEEEEEEEDQEMRMGRRIFGVNVTRAASPPRAPMARNELEEGYGSSDDENNDALKDTETLQTAEVTPVFNANASSLRSVTTAVKNQQQDQHKSSKLQFKGVTKAYSEGSKATSAVTDASRPEAKPVALPSNINTWSTVNIDTGSRPTKQKNQNPDNEDDDAAASEEAEDDALPFVAPSNLELVQAAFGGEAEAEAEFEAERKAIEESEDEQVTSTAMPGWGSWTGDGLSKRDKMHAKAKLSDPRLQVKKPGVKPSNRKDAKLKRVIISEKQVKKNAKYLTPNLPYPFETRLQYERSLRIPIGPEWTTKETFQKTTKPRVIVRGGIIEPMRKPVV